MPGEPDGLPSDRRCIFGIDATVVSYDGATYFVPDHARHRPVSRIVLAKAYAEPPLHNLVAQIYAQRTGNMVHAGTFFGDMLPSFSKKVPGSIFAFEPVLENYLLARTTVEVNALDNVVLYHAALGSAAGPATIVTGRGGLHLGGSSFMEGMHGTTGPTRTQRVPLLSIDGLGIANLALIQLDVEGFELEVLKGARETIAACKPVIVVEDKRRNCAAFLGEAGYENRGAVSENQLYVPR